MSRLLTNQPGCPIKIWVSQPFTSHDDDDDDDDDGYDDDDDINLIPPRAHIDRMKAKKGATVRDCPPDYDIVREEFYEPGFTSYFMNLDFGFIGGVIVATGIALAKPFVLAFF